MWHGEGQCRGSLGTVNGTYVVIVSLCWSQTHRKYEEIFHFLTTNVRRGDRVKSQEINSVWSVHALGSSIHGSCQWAPKRINFPSPAAQWGTEPTLWGMVRFLWGLVGTPDREDRVEL